MKKEALGSNCLQFFSDGLWLQALLGVDVEGGWWFAGGKLWLSVQADLGGSAGMGALL